MARTTGVINGTALLVYDGTTPFGYSTSCKISFSSDMRDITNKDSAGWKAVLPGLKSWNCEGAGLVVMDENNEGGAATYGLAHLYSLIANKTRVTLKFKSTNTDDWYFQGYAYLSQASQDAPNEGNTTYSMSFTGDGALTLYDPAGTYGPS